MSLSLRTVAIALVLVLGYAGFVVAFPSWSQELGLDVWNYLTESNNLNEYKSRSDELDLISQKVKQRLSIKIMVTQDLIDNRISLDEAIDHFFALDHLDPEIISLTRDLYPAASERESVAKQVLSFVKIEFDRVRKDSTGKYQKMELEFRKLFPDSAQ